MKIKNLPQALLREISLQLGISEAQARSAVKALVPKLSAHLIKQLKTANGRKALLSALRRGRNKEYVEQPETFTHESAHTEGNAIVGQIFGSRRAAQEAVEEASKETKLDPSVMQRILPLVATAVLAVLSRQLPKLLLRSPLAAAVGIAVLAAIRTLAEEDPE